MIFCISVNWLITEQTHQCCGGEHGVVGLECEIYFSVYCHHILHTGTDS